MGRPAYKVTPEIIAEVEEYAAKGLTLEQISTMLGITYKTLNEKSKKFSDLSDALKRGKTSGIEQVANALFQKAIAGDTVSMLFYLKCRAGWRDNEPEKIEQSGMADVLKLLVDKLPK